MNDPYTHLDGYWIGRMAVTLGESIAYTSDTHTKNAIREVLSEYVTSPISTEYMRDTLRPYLKGKR